MRLVNEAIRDIMLYLEQNQNHTSNNSIFEQSTLSYSVLAKALTPSKNYSHDEVMYAVIQLYQGGYIDAKIQRGKPGHITGCTIYDITPAGHELINNIRPHKIWQKVKEQAEKEGILSLTNLVKLCSKTTELIAENSEIAQTVLNDILSQQ